MLNNYNNKIKVQIINSFPECKTNLNNPKISHSVQGGILFTEDDLSFGKTKSKNLNKDYVKKIESFKYDKKIDHLINIIV